MAGGGPSADDVTMNMNTLHRPLSGRLVAGVAAGVAEQLDVDVVLVRMAFVVLGLVGGLGLPLYVAGWLLVPDEGSDEPIAQRLIGSFHGG